MTKEEFMTKAMQCRTSDIKETRRNYERLYDELAGEVEKARKALNNADSTIKELAECLSPDCSGECLECHYAQYLKENQNG